MDNKTNKGVCSSSVDISFIKLKKNDTQLIVGFNQSKGQKKKEKNIHKENLLKEKNKKISNLLYYTRISIIL